MSPRWSLGWSGQITLKLLQIIVCKNKPSQKLAHIPQIMSFPSLIFPVRNSHVIGSLLRVGNHQPFKPQKKHPLQKKNMLNPKSYRWMVQMIFLISGLGDFLLVLVPAVKIFRSVLFHVVQESTMTHSTSPSKGFCDASILTGSSDESNDATNSGWWLSKSTNPCDHMSLAAYT